MVFECLFGASIGTRYIELMKDETQTLLRAFRNIQLWMAMHSKPGNDFHTKGSSDRNDLAEQIRAHLADKGRQEFRTAIKGHYGVTLPPKP